MKSISEFKTEKLSKFEMKEIVGGVMSEGNELCRVCSSSPIGGACGSTYNLSRTDAESMASELNQRNDGYYYYADCRYIV